MPKKPNCSPEPANAPDPDSSREGRSEKGSYYYDDAHGYETYDPMSDDDEAEPDEKKPGQRTDPA